MAGKAAGVYDLKMKKEEVAHLPIDTRITTQNYSGNGALGSIISKVEPNDLCLIQDTEFSTVGMGRMSEPFHLFYVGEKGVYVRKNEHDTLELVIDVHKTVNPVTGEGETLTIKGNNRKGIWYNISKKDAVPIRFDFHTSHNCYNEGTFSPAGGVSWTAHTSERTKEIITSQWKVNNVYSRCIDDLLFRREAMEVTIPVTYLPSDGHNPTLGTGNVAKEHYDAEIQTVYAIDQIKQLVGVAAEMLFNDIFNINKDRDRAPELNPQYFTYNVAQGDTKFYLRHAPGMRGRVWVQPRTPRAKIALQLLPNLVKKKFPVQHNPSHDLHSLSEIRIHKLWDRNQKPEDIARDEMFLRYLRNLE